MKRLPYSFFVVLTSVFLLASCADMFQGKIDASDLPNGTLDEISKNPNATIELTAPSQVFVSKAESIDRITLTWSKVPYADFYYVYRAEVFSNASNSTEPTEDEYELVRQVYNTVFQDDTIVENITSLNYQSAEYKKHYYYKVSAYSAVLATEGPFSNAEYGYLFAPPLSVTASTGASYDRIDVSWTETKGAIRYEIYRTRDPSEIGNNPISSTVSRRYSDHIAEENQGAEFYYYIKAINKSSAVTKLSPNAMGFALKNGAPPAVSGLTASKATSNSKITLSWTPLSNAKNYILYRNSSTSSQLDKVGDKISTPSFVDSTEDSSEELKLQQNIKYKYYVQAITELESGEEVKGPFSSDILTSDQILSSNDESVGYLLSYPQNIVAVADLDNEIPFTRITFTAPVGYTSSYRYKILYSTSFNGSYSDIGISVQEVSEANYEAIHSGISQGFYMMITEDGSNQSLASPAIETAPLPVTQLTITKTIENANTNGVFPLKLDWDAVAGAVSYDVYRSTSANSGFRKLNTSALSTRTFTDASTTISGVYYYYKVLSLNSMGVGVFSSQTAVKVDYGYLNPRALYKEMEKTINSSQKKLKLMWKPASLDKLGSESASGKLSGSLSYNAAVAGLGARIIMHYSNYSDFQNNYNNAPIMVLNGNTNTSANMSSNGTMDGTVSISGMYRGSVSYDKIEIKGGDAGGGYYDIAVTAGSDILRGTVNYKGE
ncbi:MAG: hypothetical protein ACRC4W_06500 [Treponemataceae bacterium]